MAMSNSMAFISQFGEYNPGGGKDEVLKYLEESKKQRRQMKQDRIEQLRIERERKKSENVIARRERISRK